MNTALVPALPLDALTSTTNREAFCGRVDAALAASGTLGHSVAVLYIDLDDFKAVNRQHGRAVGDELLRSAGIRLAQASGDAAMLSRVGGDEFACLLIGLPDATHLEPHARRLLAAIAQPIKVGALELRLSSSIGIVFCDRPGTDANTMLEWAARAMYRARHEKSGYAFNNYQGYSAQRPLFRFGKRDVD